MNIITIAVYYKIYALAAGVFCVFLIALKTLRLREEK
jgi:hypothetical protein